MDAVKAGDRVRVPYDESWDDTDYAPGDVVSVNQFGVRVRLDNGYVSYWAPEHVMFIG